MDKNNNSKSNTSSNNLTFLEKKDINFIFQPTIEKFFTKFLNSTTENYVFHSQINISNEEENSFIFLTKLQIVLTQAFNQEKEDFKENPVLLKIDYKQVNQQ